jgi:adenylate cyclase
VRSDLRRFLLDSGASEEDVERALTEGWLPLLTLDRLATPGHPRHDVAEVVALTGADEEELRRLWRAVGFPDVPDGLVVFSDADVEAARLVLDGAFGPRSDFAKVLRHVRVISLSMARVASVLADYYGDKINDLRTEGVGDETIAWALVEDFDGEELAALLVYAAGLQLRAAVWRRLARDAAPDLAVAIGFADLAGYTQLSSDLDSDELAAFVGRWEELVYDTVAKYGGRVVKTIGDEVMFAGLSAQVARTALALRGAALDQKLPAVRAGIAAGMVIARDGDFYGPVVNLASRLSEIAPADTIFASQELHADLAGDPSFVWSELGTHDLRSIGSVEVYSLLAAKDLPA